MNSTIENRATKTPWSPQMLRLLVLLYGSVYIVATIVLLVWQYRHVPHGSGSLFVSVWMAFVFLIPIFVPLRIPVKVLAVLCSVLVLSAAILLQYGIMHYHLYGPGVLCFALIWTIGWYIQERNASRVRQLSGAVGGALVVVINSIFVVGQVQEAWHIWQLKSLNPSQIDVIRLHDDLHDVTQQIESFGEIEKIVASLRETYPLEMGRRRPEDLNAHAPWSVRIYFNDPRRTLLTFRIGHGHEYNPEAAWIVSQNGRDYQNIPLVHTLRHDITPGLWIASGE